MENNQGSMNGLSATTIPKLDNKNYQSWVELVKIVLELKNLKKAIESDEAEAPVDLQARLIILGSMDESHRAQTRGCSSAKAIWDRLKLIYADNSAANIYRLLMQYYRYDKKQEDSIGEHIGKMDDMRRQLDDLGEKQSEAVYQVTLIGSLPSEYASIMEIWELTHKDMRTTSNLVSRLLKREEDLKKGGLDSHALAARFNRPRMTRKEIEEKKKNTNCGKCGEKGHWHKECPQGNSAHIADSQAQGEDYGEVCFNVTSGGKLEAHIVSDSGASEHMCCHFDWFDIFEATRGRRTVAVGGGRELEVAGVGSIKVEAFVGDRWIVGKLSDVLYVPQLAANLFSIPAAARKGITTTFAGNECWMKLGDKIIASGAMLSGKLYLMRFRVISKHTPTAHALVTLEDYHRRLGHVSVARIKTLLKDLDMKVPEGEQVNCETCPGGKGKHASHPGVGPRAEEPGHIHVDLSGIENKESIKGFLYYMLCKDEATSFDMVYFCKRKSQVPELLAKMIIDFEEISHKPVKAIITDNGSEFINSTVETLCLKERISHHTSAPYCPQQNGRIEREMQSIGNMARTLLIASRLPVGLWPEAVASAVYLKNRLPLAKEITTPYERLLNKKPYIEHILEFGLPVHVIVNDQYLHKWDPRTVEGFVVGHTARRNTYKVFVPARNRVIETCDVIISRHTEKQQVSQSSRESTEESRNVCVDVPAAQNVSTSVSQGSSKGSRRDSLDEAFRTCRDHSTPANRLCTGSRLDNFFENYYNTGEPEYQEISDREQVRYVNVSNTRPSVPPPLPPTAPGGVEQEPSGPPTLARHELSGEPALTENDASDSSFLQIEQAPSHSQNLPDQVGLMCLMADAQPSGEVPRSYSEAVESDKSEMWKQAIEAELAAHRVNQTWRVVDRPDDKGTLTTKWVFTIKRDAAGKIEKYKARLVARGFEQRQGVDFEQTFAPVARLDTIRALLAVAAVVKRRNLVHSCC